MYDLKDVMITGATCLECLFKIYQLDMSTRTHSRK